MPEAESERRGLDALGATAQLLTHQPEPTLTQIAMQAHAAVVQHRIMDGAHRHAELPGQIAGVDRVPDAACKDVPYVLEDAELPLRVRARRPFGGDDVDKGGVDPGKQGFANGGA